MYESDAYHETAFLSLLKARFSITATEMKEESKECHE